MAKVPAHFGSTEQGGQPASQPNATSDLSTAVQASTGEGATTDDSGGDTPSGDTGKEEPPKEPTLDELGLTEEQLAAIKKVKQKEIDAVNDHWKSTTAKQGQELGRLRKLENTLYELDQKESELTKAETENEYDTDKRIELGSQKLNVQSQKKDVQKQILVAQTQQKVPDFEELVSAGYIKTEVVNIGKMNGIENPTETDIQSAIEALRANPVQALVIANSARKEKKIAELSTKNTQIINNTNDLATKVTTAGEQKIITGTQGGKPQYTSADIHAMSREERLALIDAGRKNGSFVKK